MPHIDDKQVLWKEKDGIVTVLHISSSEFYELNALGSTIWKMLAEAETTDAIIDSLAKKYDTTREQLALDVHAFIVKMIAADLLKN